MLETYLQHLESTGVRLNFAPGSDLVGLISNNDSEREATVDQLGMGFARLLQFYKHKAFPSVSRSMASVKSIIDTKYEQEQIKLPSIEYVSFDEVFIPNIETSTHRLVINKYKSSLPDKPDFSVLVKTEYTDFLDTITFKDKESAYNAMNSVLRNERSIHSIMNGSIKEMQIIFAIVSGLNDDIMKGTLGKLSDYKSDIVDFKYAMLAALQITFSEYVSAIENKYLWRKINPTSIELYKEVTDLFYSSGGTIEMIQGMMQLSSPYRKVSLLLEHKDELIVRYNQMISDHEFKKRIGARDVYTESYKIVANKIYESFKNDQYVKLSNDEFNILLNRKLINMSDFDIMNIKDIIEYIHIELFSELGFGNFVKIMSHYNTELPNTPVNEIVNMVMMELMTDLIVENLQ